MKHAPILAAFGVALATASAAYAQALPDKWCSDVRIRYFVGGAEGDAFGTIVYNGAKQAENDLGPTVEYLFSGWNVETMIQQLREAVASGPDGIAMMGHPGDAAIMPLAQQAHEAGIEMMYQNVPVPDVMAAYGGGYIGAQQAEQGRALGEVALERGNLQAGDTAIVFGPFDMENRGIREISTADVLEEAGLNVVRINSPVEWYADPNMGIPVVTAAILNAPDLKAISFTGGGILGNTATYLQAAGKEPGEVFAFGFDLSPQIMQAFDDGWLQLAADQQPFMQGYLPILSLCQQIVLGLAPMNVDTGAGFVTTDNYKAAAELAAQNLR